MSELVSDGAREGRGWREMYGELDLETLFCFVVGWAHDLFLVSGTQCFASRRSTYPGIVDQDVEFVLLPVHPIYQLGFVHCRI